MVSKLRTRQWVLAVCATIMAAIAGFLIFSIYKKHQAADLKASNELMLLRNKNRHDYDNLEEIKSLYLASLPAEKKIFEKEISQLLKISTNNYINTGWDSQRIDWAERQKLFTASGWRDYLLFVQHQRQNLLARTYDLYEPSKVAALIEQKGLDIALPKEATAADKELQTKCYPEWVYGSQKYISKNGLKNFTSIFYFLTGPYDMMSHRRGEDYKIEIEYSSTSQHPILISAWKVEKQFGPTYKDSE